MAHAKQEAQQTASERVLHEATRGSLSSWFVLAANLTLRGAPRTTRGKGRADRLPMPLPSPTSPLPAQVGGGAPIDPPRPQSVALSWARVACTDLRRRRERRRERLVRGRVEWRDVVSRGQVGLHFPLGGELTHRGIPYHDVDCLLEAPEDRVLDVWHAMLAADGLYQGRRLLVREHREVRPKVMLHLRDDEGGNQRPSGAISGAIRRCNQRCNQR